MRPRQAVQTLEVMRESLSSPLYRKGVRLSANDSQTVIDTYFQWVLLLLDLGYLSPVGFARDSRRLLSEMIKVDVLVLNESMSECLQCVKLQTSKGFKVLCSHISNHLYHFVKDDIAMIMRGDVIAAGRLIQVFAYMSHLSLRDIDLQQQMIDDYLTVEDNMSPHYDDHLTRCLNKIMRQWVETFDPSDLVCQHGPGGVSGHGRVSYEVKYRDLTTDTLLRYAFGEPTWTVGPILSTMDRISQTIFVPKSYKSFRTISMEPSTLMYFQQGVMHELDRMVSSQRYLHKRMSVHDQERNQQLAKQGSYSRDFSTIDLSAASDSVSYELVKQIFRGTKLLRFLVATRSKKTLLPDGRCINLKKFAPMGSALCFPIETLIFASVCEYVTRVLGVSAPDYSVYGDDIIVRSQATASVVDILTKLGFRVNHSKSFVDVSCWFRESCGGEYVNGFDVSPIRVSRRYSHIDGDVRMEALIDSANRAYKKGYRYLRAFFMRRIWDQGYIPLFSLTSLLSDSYSNYHAEVRWRRDYQRYECRISDDTPRHNADDLLAQDESIRYRHWLECCDKRTRVIEAFVSVVCYPTKSSRRVWREKPPESSDQGLS